MYEATANFIGKDGFNWWIGQVENNGIGSYDVETKEFVEGDYDWSNKVKVRIVGYHARSRVDLPTEELPWAQVIMPPIYAQRSGIGSIHQLQINSWVVGFFMDGAAAQIPIVMGALTDENPLEPYGVDVGSEEGFAQLAAKEYDELHHVSTGSGISNSGSTVEVNEETGHDQKVSNNNTFELIRENTKSDNNKSRQNFINESEAGELASASLKASVIIANGKCGSESSTKLKGPIAEFMKFARGVEKNDIDEFVDKITGDVVDMDKAINKTANRITKKLSGLTANIKGVVMSETNKLIQDNLDKLNIPNPDLDDKVKKELKGVGDLVSCLFKDLLGDLGNFIKGLLGDLVENLLDAALCMIQDILGEIMKQIMSKVNAALGILKGITGAIKGARDQIQGILSKVGDLLDLFCDGALSCAIGASSFDTGVGARKEGNEEKQDQINQYAFQPPNLGTVIGNGKPKNGFVPFVGPNGVQKAFDTTTGALVDLDSDAGKASGLTSKDFDTRGPLEKFEDITFYDSDGKAVSEALNCSPANRNLKPCFPELIWKNLKSTTPVKAIAIVDDIGQMLGVLMRKKGKSVNRQAELKAQFTCNKPEGSGATFRPNIIDGKVDSVEVLTTGIGYGFDPADIFCPKEQYAVRVSKVGLKGHVNDGDYIMMDDDRSDDILQVVDVDWDEDHMLFATVDPSENSKIEVGMKLKTKSGHKFVLNFNKKFPHLVIPTDAKAIYAKCGDLIPRVNKIKNVNVGSGYENPIITIGRGKKKKQIGTYTVDSKGRLVEPKLTETVLGFVKPRVEDAKGSGGKISVIYEFSGPRELKESNILPLTRYIDCVGHPMLKKKAEDETTELVDSGINLVEDTGTIDLQEPTTVTPSAPTVSPPVSTPINQEPQQQNTQQNQQTQQQDNNQQNQGGYGGGY